MPSQFKIGDKALCTPHGVGVIEGIESKEILGATQDFYVLKILSSGVKMMVATSSHQKSLRPLVSQPQIQKIFRTLKQKVDIPVTTWNRRFRGFTDKIKSGNIFEVAEVLRDLSHLAQEKDLSSREKEILERARELIVEEISASNGEQCDKIVSKIDRVLH